MPSTPIFWGEMIPLKPVSPNGISFLSTHSPKYVSPRTGKSSGFENHSPKQAVSDRKEPKKLAKHEEIVSIVEIEGSYRSKLLTKVPFKAGEVICRIEGVTLDVPKRYTSVQYGVDKHLELNSDLVYMNHSCNPSVSVDMDKMEVRANHDLAAGDDLTFFYPSTEWDMDQPFICWCGAPECSRMIGGAKYLTVAQLSRYFVNKHIIELICKALALKARSY